MEEKKTLLDLLCSEESEIKKESKKIITKEEIMKLNVSSNIVLDDNGLFVLTLKIDDIAIKLFNIFAIETEARDRVTYQLKTLDPTCSTEPPLCVTTMYRKRIKYRIKNWLDSNTDAYMRSFFFRFFTNKAENEYIFYYESLDQARKFSSLLRVFINYLIDQAGMLSLNLTYNYRIKESDD